MNHPETQASSLEAHKSLWTDLGDDPNRLEVRKNAVEKLKRARQSSGVTDRVGWIAEQCRGLKVLDIGVVEHTARHAASKGWLHGRIADVAGYCLGIDILESDVQRLQGQGYNIRMHDFTRSPLNDKFDLAVMGDVLEHLSNPGDFLANLRDSLVESGRVIVSAPNPWYLAYPLRNLFQKSFYYESADHCSWYDANTIQELFAREGFQLQTYRGVVISRANTKRAKFLITCIPWLLRIGFAHELFSKTMLYVFQKNPAVADPAPAVAGHSK